MKHNNDVTVVSCPPCGENVGLPTKRGFLNKGTFLIPPHRPYGALPPQVGKSTARAFTLIELLVVVLIIGILAAVALPQYKVAVAKSRLAAIKPIIAGLKTAEEIYYTQNGDYTTDLSELDISSSCSVVPNPELDTDNSLLSCNSTFIIDVIGAPETSSSVNRITAWYCPGFTTDKDACNANMSFWYKVWFNHSDKPYQESCEYRSSNALGRQVCKAIN